MRKKESDRYKLPIPYKKRDVRELANGLSLLEEESERERIEFYRDAIDERGVCHIPVIVHSEEELYSPYGGKRSLGPGLFEHVDRFAENFPLDAVVALDFYLPESLLQDEKEIARLYKEGRLYEYQQLDVAKRRSHRSILALTFGGILFILLFSLLSAFKESLAITPGLVLLFLIGGELLSNAEWVLLWEAFDKFFFGENARKKKRLRVGQLALASLSFHPLSKE